MDKDKRRTIALKPLKRTPVVPPPRPHAARPLSPRRHSPIPPHRRHLPIPFPRPPRRLPPLKKYKLTTKKYNIRNSSSSSTSSPKKVTPSKAKYTKIMPSPSQIGRLFYLDNKLRKQRTTEENNELAKLKELLNIPHSSKSPPKSPNKTGITGTSRTASRPRTARTLRKPLTSLTGYGFPIKVANMY
jgi:hypothetical protein